MKERIHAASGRRSTMRREGQPLVEIPLSIGVVGALIAPHVSAVSGSPAE